MNTVTPRLPPSDGLTLRGQAIRRGYRTRSWVLCHLGWHRWALHRNTDVGGARAEYRLCRRCGRERNEYEACAAVVPL